MKFKPKWLSESEKAPVDQRLQLRIGINVGDIILEGGDIFGEGVNVAARLESLAEPGGVALSGDAYSQVRDRLDLTWRDGGEHVVKNISRPVHTWQWSPEDHFSVQVSEVGREPLPLPDRPSIVVLPFNNLSGDPEQNYFSDGITEDITTELSRFSDLFVIARNTAFTFKDRNIRATDIALELGVHFVLEGSVRRSGERTRINAQLIDGLDGNHLWADRYDGSAEEVFDLQDQVTCKVVSAMMPSISDAELARIQRGDRLFDRAHDLAWQAYGQLREGIGLGKASFLRIAKAKAFQAIELNERCFRAYLSICIADWLELMWQEAAEPGKTLAELKDAADTFVNLSPTSHSAHFCHGVANLMARQTEAAAQDLRHSIELNPNDASVLSLLADVEVQLDNLKEAKAIAAKAIRLNPKDTTTGTAYLALAQISFVEEDGQFRHWAEKAIRAQPRAPARRLLMIAYASEIGDDALLREHLEELNKFAPRLLPRFLQGEVDFIFGVPNHRERILKALRKARL